MIERPLIFISNDDGHMAKGINCLIDALRGVGDLVVVAPSGPRSGAAGAITSEAPVKVSALRQEPGLTVYSCTGTPVDCTKLGLQEFCFRTPDIVIGGINHGSNAACNVHYSGTMGIVIEGALKHIPSVGFSLCDFDKDADFAPCLPFCRSIVEKVLEKGLPDGTCLNVNFPKASSFKGVKVCRQASGDWVDEWEAASHPRGEHFYWLTGRYENHSLDDLTADDTALREGYVAITPTRVDVTDLGMIDEIKGWNL